MPSGGPAPTAPLAPRTVRRPAPPTVPTTAVATADGSDDTDMDDTGRSDSGGPGNTDLGEAELDSLAPIIDGDTPAALRNLINDNPDLTSPRS